MPVVPPSAENITRAGELLRAGRLVAFPTETVYGLGGNARDSAAVGRIYAAKGRPSTNPLIVHIPHVDDLSDVTAPLSPTIEARLRRLLPLWPGPLTIVLPAHPALSPLATAGLHSVGVRIPAHPVALALLREARVPVAAPSANPSSYVSPTTAAHVAHGLGDQVDLILDGGECAVGVESTVLSLLYEPTVLRPGAITHELLESLLHEPVTVADAHASLRPQSPGMSALHYAPHTRVSIRGSISPHELPTRTGLIAFREGPLEFDYSAVRTLSKEGNLEEVAHGLYRALRELDDLGLALIVLDTCAEVGLGRAIMDRVRRAAAGRR